MSELKVSSVQEVQAASGLVGEPIQLPSGLVFVLKRASIETFIRSGQMSNPLFPIVEAELTKARGKEPEAFDAAAFGEQMTKDPANIFKLMDLVNDVVVGVVVQPTIEPIPESGVPKALGHLYVDEVNLEDKFFIFQYAVGGARDLDKFRERFTFSMDAVQSGQTTAPKTQRTRKSKK